MQLVRRISGGERSPVAATTPRSPRPARSLGALALFAPLYGALISLFVVWHSHHNGLEARRNIAIACTALAIFDLLAPDVILPAITS